MSVYTAADVMELLNAVAPLGGADKLACLVPQRGSAYESGRLLVVGRATNEWGTKETQFTPEALAAPGERARLAEATSRHVGSLSWVQDVASSSAFWRVSRGVAAGLGVAGADGPEWYERLAWSNLYKVAPADGGNPSDALTDAQLGACGRLLRGEIEILQPRWVLFLVGCGENDNWFQWFEAALDFRLEGEDPVDGRSVKRGRIGDSRVAVIPHPQGKPEGPLVEAALRALLD